MKKKGLYFSLLVAGALVAAERLQGPTELLFWDKAKALNGYTLFGAAGTSYLLDMEGKVAHTWQVGTNPRFLDNGNLLDASRDDPSGFQGLKEVDWDGKTVWEYVEKREDYSPHHDWVRIFNKKLNAPTTLYIANKSITNEQALAAGADPRKAPYEDAEMDAIVEVDMQGNVIWEWWFFDHMVQDIDPAKANYVGAGKSIANYPGRLNINLPGKPLRGDWLHCNSIDYSAELDQIVTNSVQGELYVIDHGSTFVKGDPKASIAKAKGPAGDFLYRFGDPARYKQGEPPRVLENWDNATSGNKQMGGSHHAHWIEPGLPGAGHLMVFNNGQYLFERTPQSSIIEINPFLDAGGRDTGKYVNPPDAGYREERYHRDTHKSPRQISKQVVWTYRSKTNMGFFSHIGSSGQRLANGNTLICSDTEGHIFEVTASGELAWEYINPVTREGAVKVMPDSLPMTNSIFRAFRYTANHPALKGKDLTAKLAITDLPPRTRAKRVGQTVSSVPMTTIPSGSFEMGDHHGFVDPKHPTDELPLHNVRLDAFQIGINNVTNKEYAEFLNASKDIEVRNGAVYLKGGNDTLCDTRKSSQYSRIGWDGKLFSVLDGKEDHPMVCVRWHGAAAYCNWRSTRENRPAVYNTSTWQADLQKSGYRLPTEAEWEYAARGAQQSPYFNYPWGNDADPAKANVPESTHPFRKGPMPLTTPVGFFNGKLQRKADFNWPGSQESYQTVSNANGYGLYDMAGNVWQWCNELYERNYYANSATENPAGPAQGSPMPDGKVYRAMRGGSWYNGEFGHSRVSNRDPSYFRGPDPASGKDDPDGPWFHIGFRVVLPVGAETRALAKPTPEPMQPPPPQADRPRGGGGPRGPRLLPRNVEEQLQLTGEQREKIDALEKETAAKLATILTPEQRKLMENAPPPPQQQQQRRQREAEPPPDPEPPKPRRGEGQDRGQRGGGGGGGRVQEDNKTPVSPSAGQTIGLFLNLPKAAAGYTLLAPKHNTTTYLLDNQGRAVHEWKSEYEPGQSVYLKPNGNLLRTCMTKNRSFTGGGEGGRIEEYDWNGKLVWEFTYSNDKYQQHHDIAPMPNGNILMLVVEKKSLKEAIAAGFTEDMLRDEELYPDSVVEVQPVYPKGGNVVWEWHVWDHMIQDLDRAKSNFGDVAAHPELIYTGANGRGIPAFWNHVNSIAYNAKLNQIVLSARGSSEIWFIDHSTTAQEASSHKGGKHGKGGDLIYRWGNPAAYKRGTERDAQLNQQHDAQWIPDGYPGAGHVTIFNNGYDRRYTSIEEIAPAVDANGHYSLEPVVKPVWHYEAPNRTDFFSSEISGAHRLANGNTLICAGVIGNLFEVTPAGETVWQYVNPVVRGGTLAQGEVPGKDVRGHLFNAVFKAHRYAPDFPGLAGRQLTPIGPIELPASEKGKTGFDRKDASQDEGPRRERRRE